MIGRLAQVEIPTLDKGEGMTGDEKEFWNDVWSEPGGPYPEADQFLKDNVRGFTPGKALDIGCGVGANAIWLAEQGWQVTGVDFSEAAIERAKSMASIRGVEVEFVVADAASHQPRGEYQLITMFYLHLPPEDRAKLLESISRGLSAGGALLFVGHDRSAPPSGWSQEHLATLTIPDDIVREIPMLVVEEAAVLEDNGGGSHGAHVEAGQAHDHSHQEDQHELGPARATVVRARKPQQ